MSTKYYSCYYQISNIGLTRKYTDDETCPTLVEALIISGDDDDDDGWCFVATFVHMVG